MTKTLEALLETTGRVMAEIRPEEICAKCKDDSACDECAFQPPRQERTHLTVKAAKEGGRLAFQDFNVFESYCVAVELVCYPYLWKGIRRRTYDQSAILGRKRGTKLFPLFRGVGE